MTGGFIFASIKIRRKKKGFLFLVADGNEVKEGQGGNADTRFLLTVLGFFWAWADRAEEAPQEEEDLCRSRAHKKDEIKKIEHFFFFIFTYVYIFMYSRMERYFFSLQFNIKRYEHV